MTSQARAHGPGAGAKLDALIASVDAKLAELVPDIDLDRPACPCPSCRRRFGELLRELAEIATCRCTSCRRNEADLDHVVERAIRAGDLARFARLLRLLRQWQRTCRPDASAIRILARLIARLAARDTALVRQRLAADDYLRSPPGESLVLFTRVHPALAPPVSRAPVRAGAAA